jgi:hypothetical protein
LSFLGPECGGNCHEHGVVNITHSSDGYNKCHHVVGHGENRFWATNSYPRSWIQFDFKDSSINLTDYALKSDAAAGAICFNERLRDLKMETDGNVSMLETRRI